MMINDEAKPQTVSKKKKGCSNREFPLVLGFWASGKTVRLYFNKKQECQLCPCSASCVDALLRQIKFTLNDKH